MIYIASEEDYKDGEIIIEEGTSGDWVYVVQSGEVEISKTIGGKRCVVSMLGQGEVFGELGFLGGVTRTATARAIGEASVGVVDRAFLDKEFNRLSSDFRDILVALVKRFKQMSDRTTEISSRQGTRVKTTFSLSYEDKESFVAAYTENVGGGGLFVRTENPLEPGEKCVLKLQLPGLTDPLKITCEVAWAARATKQGEKTHVPHGMGVKFIESANKDSQTLKQYLGH